MDKETEAQREEVGLDSNVDTRLQSLGLTWYVCYLLWGRVRASSDPTLHAGGA